MGNSRSELVKYIALFLVLVVAAFGSIYVLRAALGTEYPLMVVVSESMVPTLGVGDFILVGHIDDFNTVVAAPQPEGDILVFERSTDDYIVHRAIGKIMEYGVLRFVTKGDHNPVADGQTVPEERVIGKVVGRIPILGYFPLFIKTFSGLIMVATLMGVVFFADYLLPVKRGNPNGHEEGRFPWVSILPFLAAPLTLIAFWFVPDNHMSIELVALSAWYVGSLIAPLAFGDDDLCFMFWLYNFVLLMIPIGCDLVWWMTGITPSRWWLVQGSSLPLTWLLMQETALFSEAFSLLLWLLLPGCILFLLSMLLKRRKIQPFAELSRRLRTSV